ncbi:family 3 adenylate cyclase [Xenococcus sp. PCC 7305]|uniref:GAF domain-containing protein n=1 Tax=Xenococcus sp. PCC 7305 TaxID=102125 RepID=UPI0002ACB023|nr:GAF domain-containing protein [Xenococcus sp. PCC 7305]ELS04175.1 family 3 adenylate cyclase [Xenococcus sp. PCC 7305]
MEITCPKLEDLSWETICQNIVETIGIVLHADVSIICAKSILENKPQCFFYQAEGKSIPSIDGATLQKTVPFPNNMTILKNFDQDCLGDARKCLTPRVYDACQNINVKSSLSIPLTDQNNLKATLTLHRCQSEDHWQPEEIKLASKMAAQAGLAIAQIEAYENMRNLAQREATLNRIINAIRGSLEPQVMFNAIVTELGSALQVDGCSLSLWKESDRFMHCMAFYNPQEPNSRSKISSVQIADNPILQKLLQERKPLVFKDLTAKKELARHDLPWRAKSKALLIVPLIMNGEIMGSLTLRQSALSRQWEQSEIQLAQAVATQAAIAVKQARLYDKTRRQAKQLQISRQKVEDLNYYLTESILKRFLPEAIANQAAVGKLALDLEPETQSITVLFCDLVGFTNLSSQLEVNLLSELLNEYLDGMAQAVFEQGGTIDKFLGDAVMALFGAPETLSPQEQARRAIATAQAMYRYLQPLNQKWQVQGIGVDAHLPSLQLRCGIHQGSAIVGMFGGQQRKDYTAIGKVVNIAARLQKNAAPNRILVSDTVLNNLVLPEYQEVQPQSLQLKGIEPNFIAYSLTLATDH